MAPVPLFPEVLTKVYGNRKWVSLRFRCLVETLIELSKFGFTNREDFRSVATRKKLWDAIEAHLN